MRPAAGAAVLLAALAAGSGLLLVVRSEPAPVEVETPALAPATATACRRFDAALPNRLGELERREVEPAGVGLAAYGDPAVVIRCGAPLPGTFQAGDPLLVINDVAWATVERPDDVVFTLPRSIVNVEVTIPRQHKAELLSLLAEAVQQAQPL